MQLSNLKAATKIIGKIFSPLILADLNDNKFLDRQAWANSADPD